MRLPEKSLDRSNPATQVFFFDAWHAICHGNSCPLSDRAQTFYKDQHHLTLYKALRLQHLAFADLSRFLVGPYKRQFCRMSSVKKVKPVSRSP
ncbi:SGNH hydrolase domain-containing protein [Bradyrhizobium liaoningense]|uniref:SGNH hydrolase domain-containing protein n=1 Tax=Bradyrhizobium liaoningense TaxID=43992 RepID=UPI0039089394